jgi:hypothetical protein
MYRMIDDVTLSNFRRFMQSGIPLKEFGPQGAFIAAIPKGRGRDEGGQPSAIMGMLALKAKMSPEGFKALCQELCGGEAEDGEYETPQERLEAEAYPGGKRATDEPPPFKGRPRTGGAMDAMDAMAFDKLSTPRRTKAERSFDAMYPGAGDIKINSDSCPTMSRTRT